MLAAWGEAWALLGRCLDRPKIKLLAIPRGAELVTVIPFGYQPTTKNQKKVHKRLEKVAFRGPYGQPYQ